MSEKTVSKNDEKSNAGKLIEKIGVYTEQIDFLIEAGFNTTKYDIDQAVYQIEERVEDIKKLLAGYRGAVAITDKTEGVNDTQTKIIDDIKAIVDIRNRLKWICSTPLSCDINTIGECKAFIDSVHRVVGEDVEILGETINDLKKLLALNEGGAA